VTGKRSYGEACAAAHALDLVGERWALLVVRELVLGPKRFTDLSDGIRHASPNVLAQRLRDLEAAGVVQRRKLGPPAGSRVYELTEWGLELEPVIKALGRWGSRSPLRSSDASTSVDAEILALRTMFDPELAEGIDATYEIRLGEERFRVRIAERRIEAVRGSVAEPDAVIETDPETLAAVVLEGGDLDDAERSGGFRIEGDRAAVERFVELFPMPEPAPLALAARPPG
jgi:DNA-binding HxlR family transcriptional regulator